MGTAEDTPKGSLDAAGRKQPSDGDDIESGSVGKFSVGEHSTDAFQPSAVQDTAFQLSERTVAQPATAERGTAEFDLPLTVDGRGDIVADGLKIASRSVGLSIEGPEAPVPDVVVDAAAARGEVGSLMPDTQSWEVAARIAAHQRPLRAAVQSTACPVEPVLPQPPCSG